VYPPLAYSPEAHATHASEAAVPLWLPRRSTMATSVAITVIDDESHVATQPAAGVGPAA
jgi:hypothetical protein